MKYSQKPLQSCLILYIRVAAKITHLISNSATHQLIKLANQQTGWWWINQTMKLFALRELLTGPAVQRIVQRIFTVRDLIHSTFTESHKSKILTSDSADRSHWLLLRRTQTQACKKGCASFATWSWQRSQPIQCHTVDLTCFSVQFLCHVSATDEELFFFLFVYMFKVHWIQMISTEVTEDSPKCISADYFNPGLLQWLWSRLELGFYINHRLEQHNHISISDTAVVVLLYSSSQT